MRRPVTLLVAFFLTLPLVGQTPLIEKIDVNVVNVDVAVTDRAGNPVRGLTRDDFEIFEDGKLQKVTNFYAVNAAEGGGAPPVQEERFRRKVLVIVDNVTTTRYFRDRALDRLERFVNDRFSGGEYDWSLAIVDRRPHLLLAPTSDKNQIFSAIGEIRRLVAGDDRLEPVAVNLSPDVGNTTSDASCNKIRLTGMLDAGDRLQLASSQGSEIASLTQAVRGFSSIEGKKIILLLTSERILNGSFDPFEVTACMPPNTVWDLQQSVKERTTLADYLIHEANASNVSLYIINTEGWRAGGWEKADSLGVSAAVERYIPSTTNGTLFWIGAETGGRLLPGNDVAESLKTFDSVSSNFYSLGYRPSHPEDDKYHRIKVRLIKSGDFHLQYRDGYSSLSSREQIVRLLQSPLAPAMQPSSLPLEVTFGSPVEKTKKEWLVPISVSIPTRNLTFVPGAAAPVEIFFSLFDGNGRNLSLLRFDREAKSGAESFVESHALRLRKGQQYRLVIAIRDPLTDAVGIAQQAVHF